MEEEKPLIRLSVHGLVDFLLRQGDIDNRVYNEDTMRAGTLLHAAFQEKQGNDYLREVPLKGTFERPLGKVELEGRADGVIVGGEYPVIDEIKSTVAPLEEFYETQKEWHFGQAECYALLYAIANGEDTMDVRLTYISQIDGSKARHEKRFSRAELEKDINALLDRYLALHSKEATHTKKRDESADALAFPFDNYRLGQRQLAAKVYRSARNGGLLFVEAPTGIGKTMSVLFPSAKAMTHAAIEKIFYLTAKGSGKESAKKAMRLLLEKGLAARAIELSAKEKICFSPGKNCNPDECPFAKGYYQGMRLLVEEIASLDTTMLDRLAIERMAKSREICPFELQLDLSLCSDVIIADYNYFFDPIARLERFFGLDCDASRHLLLVDESHNLLDRARGMYSSSLSLRAVEHVKKALKGKAPRGLIAAINKLRKAMGDCALEAESNQEYSDVPGPLLKALSSLSNQHLKLLKEKHLSLPQCYKDLSRECHRFSFLYENYGGYQTFYSEKKGSDFLFNAFCIDPSALIAQNLRQVRAAIFFSGTLSPVSYYMNALTGEGKHPTLLLPSPFPPENFRLLIAPHVSIRYKDRDRTYGEVSSYLKAFVEHKIGNYFLYFPSYEYLEKIKPYLSFPNAIVYEQKRDMSDAEREDFLSNFTSNPPLSRVALLIIGGAFGEGVDLLADRLIGVAIVGIGLPQLSFERDLLRRHYEESNGEGFAYAYRNPAINKVMQAIGRLIRSETDKGAALLIDDRYLSSDYRALFSRRYKGYQVVFDPSEIAPLLG